MTATGGTEQSLLTVTGPDGSGTSRALAGCRGEQGALDTLRLA